MLLTQVTPSRFFQSLLLKKLLSVLRFLATKLLKNFCFSFLENTSQLSLYSQYLTFALYSFSFLSSLLFSLRFFAFRFLAFPFTLCWVSRAQHQPTFFSVGCLTPKLLHLWSQSGSNRRPPACKADALPAELWPQLRFSFFSLSSFPFLRYFG